MERIQKANGEIISDRLDGITALSRCFGCKSMKNNDKLHYHEQKMICSTECKHFWFNSNETLMLYTHRLIERWKDSDVVKRYDFHYQQHKDYSDPLQHSLSYLIEECIDCGSTGNITAISIKFK